MKIVRFPWRNTATWGILEHETIFALDGDIYGTVKKGLELCRLNDVMLLAPVDPGITVACGMNYADQAEALNKDMGWALSEEPKLFFKPANTVIGSEEDIVYPPLSHDLRYEAELCVVMKKRAKNVPENKALDHVLGYTCGNELTALDWLQKDKRLTRAKSFDGAGPMGPCLAIGLDPHALSIKSRVNGEIKQDGHTGQMIFNVQKLISYISAFMTLNPGDVIWTGTPKGGICPVGAGDVIEVEIEGIGTLRNRVVSADRHTAVAMDAVKLDCC